MVFATGSVPDTGTVGDTVFGIVATVQDEDGDTLKNAYVFLNVNGDTKRVIGADDLNGFAIVRSDADGLIVFGAVLDTIVGPNTVHAVSIRVNLADTSVSLIPSQFTIAGTAAEVARMQFYQQKVVAGTREQLATDTLRVTDFISYDPQDKYGNPSDRPVRLQFFASKDSILIASTHLDGLDRNYLEIVTSSGDTLPQVSGLSGFPFRTYVVPAVLPLNRGCSGEAVTSVTVTNIPVPESHSYASSVFINGIEFHRGTDYFLYSGPDNAPTCSFNGNGQ